MSAVRLRLAIGAVAALGLLLVGAPVAQAHDQLVSTDPAADAVLTAAPDRVELVYTEEVVALGIVVQVTDVAGEEWVAGDAEVSGTAVSVPLRGGMGEGAYALRWRVVSSDGHPVEGASAFSIAGAVDVASSSPDPSAAPVASPTATPDEASAPPSGTAEADGRDDGATIGALPAVVIGLVALVAVVLVGLLVRAAMRRRAGGTGTGGGAA